MGFKIQVFRVSGIRVWRRALGMQQNISGGQERAVENAASGTPVWLPQQAMELGLEIQILGLQGFGFGVRFTRQCPDGEEGKGGNRLLKALQSGTPVQQTCPPHPADCPMKV